MTATATQLFLFPDMASQTLPVITEYTEPERKPNDLDPTQQRIQYLTLLRIAHRYARGRTDAKDWAHDLAHQAFVILAHRMRWCEDLASYRWTRNLRSIFRDARVQLGGGRKGWPELRWVEYEDEIHGVVGEA